MPSTHWGSPASFDHYYLRIITIIIARSSAHALWKRGAANLEAIPIQFNFLLDICFKARACATWFSTGVLSCDKPAHSATALWVSHCTAVTPCIEWCSQHRETRQTSFEKKWCAGKAQPLFWATMIFFLLQIILINVCKGVLVREPTCDNVFLEHRHDSANVFL